MKKETYKLERVILLLIGQVVQLTQILLTPVLLIQGLAMYSLEVRLLPMETPPL